MDWIGLERNGWEWIGMDWNGRQWIGMDWNALTIGDPIRDGDSIETAAVRNPGSKEGRADRLSGIARWASGRRTRIGCEAHRTATSHHARVTLSSGDTSGGSNTAPCDRADRTQRSRRPRAAATTMTTMATMATTALSETKATEEQMVAEVRSMLMFYTQGWCGHRSSAREGCLPFF